MEKYGFIYIWYDRKHKRYYVGCHWGKVDDSYICSSSWMKKAYKIRPQDFKRRIIKNGINYRPDMYIEEQRYLDMIKKEEVKTRYYNLNLKNGNLWHKYPEHIKTIGQKISHSKTGKTTGKRDPAVGKKISEAKKLKFAERGGMSEEHKAALRGKTKPHTEKWKQQNSQRMKQQWSDGTRKRAEPKKTMTREEQDVLCSTQLKNRWADPEWSTKQKEALKQSWIKRKEKLNNNELC